MDTLTSMRIFVRVADMLSFSRAAEQLSMIPSQVSRAITLLEKRLHARLLHRTTRQAVLTEAGERYLQQCKMILSLVEIAEAEATCAQFSPTGTLRIHATAGFGQHYAAPLVARYREHFPDVSINLALAQRVPDILEEGFDVSIVVAPALPDGGCVSRRLGSTRALLCASPDYLLRQGIPYRTEDLAGHACLQLNAPNLPLGKWLLYGPDGPVELRLKSPPFQVNIAEMLAVAIREGMGIGPLHVAAALPGLKDGSLVRVLPEFHLQPLNIYALYASRQYVDAKIKSFVDFLYDRMPTMLTEQDTALLACCNEQLDAGAASQSLSVD